MTEISRQFTNIIGKHFLMEAQSSIDDAHDKYESWNESLLNPEGTEWSGAPEEVERHIAASIFHNMQSHMAHQNGNHELAFRHLHATGVRLEKAAQALMETKDPKFKNNDVIETLQKAGENAKELGWAYSNLVNSDPAPKGLGD